MSSTIKTPRYIQSLDKTTYIPAPLRKLLNPKKNFIPDGYYLCLVGEQESIASDLKDKGYTGKSFIHLDDSALAKGGAYFRTSDKVKKAITTINDMVKRDNTVFNVNKCCGNHTLGFVPIDDIPELNRLGYGILSWHGIFVYDNTSTSCATPTDSTIGTWVAHWIKYNYDANGNAAADDGVVTPDSTTYGSCHISYWDVSGITDMSYLFSKYTGYYQASGGNNPDGWFNEDISGWKVSNVTNMEGMFYGATDFNQDISSWTTSSVTKMDGMFAEASNFNQDISSWTTSAVVDTRGMFRGASAFNQDISSWIVSNTTTLTNMFKISGITDGTYGFSVPTPTYTQFNQ